MVLLTIATIVLAAVTVAQIGWEVYNAYEVQPENDKQFVDAFWQGSESFVNQIQSVLEDFANQISEAILFIAQYMDAWGTVIVVLFATVIVVLLAMFYNVAKLRRSR